MSEIIKTQALCDRCKVNRLCEEQGTPCETCKARLPVPYPSYDGNVCGCLKILCGEPCPYYEEET